MSSLSAAVIGLGQVGSRFDEEARDSVWSHAGAYLALPDHYHLVAGADVDGGNRDRFATRVTGAELFDDATMLMTKLKPDVVSVCTPPLGRADLIEALLSAHHPRALICEKPMEVDGTARSRIISACAAAGAVLVVNYNRRYATSWRHARTEIRNGRIGQLLSVTITTPNRLWSIGSHALNLLTYLVEDAVESWTAMPLPSLFEEGEPAADVLCRFSSGVAGRVVTAGKRSELVFEVDALGTEGRLRVADNGSSVVLQKFEESQTFSGYRTLSNGSVVSSTPEGELTFTCMMMGTHGTVVEGKAIASDGASAAASEALLDDIVALCQEQYPI